MWRFKCNQSYCLIWVWNSVFQTTERTQVQGVWEYLWLQGEDVTGGCRTVRKEQLYCTKTKLHGLSSRANYTDRAAAACRRSDCQLLRIEGATWSAWRIPRPYSRFFRQEPLLFYQVAPQLYSQGWVDPIPDPLLFFVVPGNRTRDPCICSQELWPLDHRGGQ
jgi:hypothetical protein